MIVSVFKTFFNQLNLNLPLGHVRVDNEHRLSNCFSDSQKTYFDLLILVLLQLIGQFQQMFKNLRVVMFIDADMDIWLYRASEKGDDEFDHAFDELKFV